MKFATLLRKSAEDVPELQNLFVCYKQLKKKLKRLPARTTTAGVDQGMIAEERSFVQTLNADVLQFNDLFIEKEEESVIKLGDLEEQAGAALTSEEIAKVLTHAVDLHGQLLLLVHWSILAYTGLVKILKKHHKRTGFPIRAPHLENLLSQPFCSVELLTQLVRKAEDTSQQLAARLRSNGGKVEEAAKGSNSPSSPIGELILAARNSFQAIAQDAVQGEANEQASSSDESSGDHRQSAVCAVIDEPADAVSAPPKADSGVLGDTASKQKASPSSAVKRAAEDALHSAAKRRQVPSDAQAEQNSAAVSGAGQASAAVQPYDNDPKETGSASEKPASAAAPVSAPIPVSASASAGSVLPPVHGQGQRASVMRQTQAALGLWAQLHDTASTPSTVLQPFASRRSESAAISQSTDQSAA